MSSSPTRTFIIHIHKHIQISFKPVLFFLFCGKYIAKLTQILYSSQQHLFVCLFLLVGFGTISDLESVHGTCIFYLKFHYGKLGIFVDSGGIQIHPNNVFISIPYNTEYLMCVFLSKKTVSPYLLYGSPSLLLRSTLKVTFTFSKPSIVITVSD